MTLEEKVVDFLIIQHGRTREEAESAIASLLPEFLAIRVDQALRDEETKKRNEKQYADPHRSNQGLLASKNAP